MDSTENMDGKNEEKEITSRDIMEYMKKFEGNINRKLDNKLEDIDKGMKELNKRVEANEDRNKDVQNDLNERHGNDDKKWTEKNYA